MVCLYIFHRPKKNGPITDITNDDQKYYAFEPAYGEGSTDFHHHMISVVVFLYSNTLQSMSMDYVVIEMGFLDNYSDAAPRAITMRGNDITTFLLHVSQCITFNQTRFVTEKPFVEALLKSLYSRLGFKIIIIFSTLHNFEKARKKFHFEPGKSKATQKKIVLQ